jgi:CBS domain-containing protein
MVISPETSAGEILTNMSQNNVGRVLVMRGDHMLGMVTRTGLLRFLEMKKTLTRQEKKEGR